MRTPDNSASSQTLAQGPFRSFKYPPALPGKRYSSSLGSCSNSASACPLNGTYSVRFCFV
jgi:hypothetical protein